MFVARSGECIVAEYDVCLVGGYEVADDQGQNLVVQMLAVRAGEIAVQLQAHGGRRIAEYLAFGRFGDGRERSEGGDGGEGRDLQFHAYIVTYRFDKYVVSRYS